MCHRHLPKSLKQHAGNLPNGTLIKTFVVDKDIDDLGLKVPPRSDTKVNLGETIQIPQRPLIVGDAPVPL
jgi:hypothetical protein